MVDALRVFTACRSRWVGGIFALWLRDMPFSISAAIGFIALSGVAVLDDMILVSYVRQLRADGACRWTRQSRQAAITRLRPVLMTTLVASLGLPADGVQHGMGAEVQRPLATVVIGGVIGAMVMSLLVLRVLYLLLQRRRSGARGAGRGQGWCDGPASVAVVEVSTPGTRDIPKEVWRMKTSTIRAGLVAMALSGFLVAAGCVQVPRPAGREGRAGPARRSRTSPRPRRGTTTAAGGATSTASPRRSASCAAKVAKAFKEKGDWCEKHDRAKSASASSATRRLKEKFAAKYRAKYGKEPPPTEDEEEKKDDKDAKKDEPKKDPKDGKKEEKK